MSVSSFIQISRELYRNRVVFQRPYKKSTPLKSFSSDVANELEESGLVVVKNFMNEADRNTVRAAIENAWKSVSPEKEEELRQKCLDTKNYKRGVEQSGGYLMWVDRHLSDHRINGAEHLHPVIGAFAENKDFINVGENHLGTIVKLQFTMANIVHFKPENLGSGGGWHRDNCYARGFKCMLYLNDVTTDDGPFQYLPGSHKLSFHLFTENAIGKYQFAQEEMDAILQRKGMKTVEVTAKAGDLVFFDTNIIHRGKPVSQGHTRYALTNYYHYK